MRIDSTEEERALAEKEARQTALLAKLHRSLVFAVSTDDGTVMQLDHPRLKPPFVVYPDGARERLLDLLAKSADKPG